MALKEVGVRLQVGAAGLENVAALEKDLQSLEGASDGVQAKARELDAWLKRLAEQQALIDTFRRVKTETAGAGTALQDAQAQAQKLGRELAATETPTKAQAAAMDRARQAVQAAKAEYQAQQLQLQELRGRLQQAGIATDDLAAAQLRVKTSVGAAQTQVQALVAEYRQAGQAAQQAGAQQAAAQATVRDSVRNLGDQLRTVQQLASAAIGGQLLGGLVGQLSQTADAYSNLASRIRLVTGEGPAFDAAFQGVFDVATRTNSALVATGDLFARIAQAGAGLGVTQRDALALTETINQAIQVSGASAQASEAAITQLIQGLQGGVLRGDEFNSVMEQAPRLAKALADGLGVTTGELRKQAEAGKLTADVVIGALRGQAQVIEAEFSQIPATVGRALQNLSTEWTRYVGEVDKANGISAAAATALNALAANLDTIGTALKVAGQAFLAYQALKLAQTFLDKAAAVRSSAAAIADETLQLGANTAAAAANAKAHRDRGAATAGATAAAGAAAAGAAGGLKAAGEAAAGAATAMGRVVETGSKIAGLALRLAGWVGVAIALYDAIKLLAGGAWEAGKRLLGFGGANEQAAAQSKKAEQAARDDAAAKAELAQQTKLAEERALGLNAASKDMVAQFDEAVKKGTSVADALDAIAKSANLKDSKGIADFGAALDALARQGKASGAQIREAMANALKGLDLGTFEANARAAFDGSEAGARRLQNALDAIATESLRRAGTSVEELSTGFSAAATSAINDVDALANTLDGLGLNTEDAGRALAGALDKATQAASTEKALRAVEERIRAFGAAGKLSGEQVADALAKTRAKADETRSGINSLEEAMKAFGIVSRSDLQKTADKYAQAYDQIKNSTDVSIRDRIKAFTMMRDAAIAANDGVEPSQVALQRRILETQAKAQGLGEEFAKAMQKGAKATDDAAAAAERLIKVLDKTLEVQKQLDQYTGLSTPSGLGGFGGGSGTTGADAIPRGATPGPRGSTSGSTLGSTGTGTGDRAFGDQYNATPDGGIIETRQGSQMVPPDNSGDWTFVNDARVSSVDPRTGARVRGYWLNSKTGQQVAAGDAIGATGLSPSGFGPSTTLTPAGGSVGTPVQASPVPQPAGRQATGSPAAQTGSAARTVRVELAIGGRMYPVQSDADVADSLVRALTEAQRSYGTTGR